MSTKYYVSAYVTSPSFKVWDAESETKYFSNLTAQDNIIGIEQPFYSASEKYPLSWLKDNIPLHWNIILTSMPQMMQASRINPYFGLASIREEDRKKAVTLISDINNYAHTLNKLFQRDIVKAVHLHSSPRSSDGEVRGNKQSFYHSLLDIKRMEWGDIALNVEHCDAYTSQQQSDKGFLSLEDEINAINAVGHYGLILNWARSVIEARSSDGALKHIQLCLKEKLLKGFFYSGCSDQACSQYGAWKDTHMPPKNDIQSEYLPNDSLLGANEIKAVKNLLKPIKDELYYGVKVLDLPDNSSLVKKIGLNLESIRAIETATIL